MTKLALAGLVVALTVGTLPATEIEGELYGTFGAAKIEDLDAGYDLGGGGGVLFGSTIRAGFDIEGQVIHTSQDVLGIDVDLDIKIVLLNIVLEGDGPIRPYFVIGGGYANSDVSGTVSSVTLSVDLGNNGVGDAGGGIKFVINDHFMIGGDFRYFRISDVNVARGALVIGGKF
jgi:hypothetical protein